MDYLKREFKTEIKKEDSGIKGYLFKFSEQTEYMGIKERFSNDLTFTLYESCFLLRDHNPERCLGKAGKNLNIEKKEDGLFFTASPLKTSLWEDTAELIKNGVITKCSVGFQDMDSEKQGEILVYRNIKIIECSLVLWPAYKSSEVKPRAKNNNLLPPHLIEV